MMSFNPLHRADDPDDRADIRKGDEVIARAEKKRMADCTEEIEKILALIKGIESAVEENNPVKARELAQDLERVSFRWYMKTDTGT